MKKIIYLLVICCLITSVVSASEKDLSVGINFGGVLPLLKLGDTLSAGAVYPVGIFANLNTSFLLSDTEISLGGNYIVLNKKGDENTKMSFIPVSLSAIYNMPIGKNMNLLVKIGGGIVSETLTTNSSNTNNIDPLFLGGIGVSHIYNDFIVKFETDYNFIYETYQSGATENGSLITFHISTGYLF